MDEIEKQCIKYKITKCIKQILDVYDLGWKKETGIIKDEYMNVFHFDYLIRYKHKTIGNIHFEIDLDKNILYLSSTSIKYFETKGELPFKILRLILIHAICKYSKKFNKIILEASPGAKNGNCLICMYEKMGFVPTKQVVHYNGGKNIPPIKMKAIKNEIFFDELQNDIKFIVDNCNNELNN